MAKQAKRFWNFSPPKNDNEAAELILYGDISESSWWGDEVTPRQFSEELKALGDVNEIVVRINSGGGDVFAANAIYTRLKDHKAKITVKVDGWAASAATIIAMSGDVTEIPANGVFMIHEARMGLMGYYSAADFEKMTAELKVINQSIVNGYAAKTGKGTDEIAALMATETWYDGVGAVEAGFIDRLMFENAQTQVENAGRVVVNSVPFNLAEFPSLPTSLLNRCVTKHSGFANKNAPQGQKESEKMDTNAITTIEELKAAYPQLVNQVADEATAAERQRIQDIENVTLTGFEEISQAAKFEKPATAAELATAIIAAQKQQGAQFLANREADIAAGNVNKVGAEGREGTSDNHAAELDALIDKVLPK